MLFALTLIACLCLYGLSTTIYLLAPFFKSVDKDKNSWKASLLFSSAYAFAILVLWISFIATDIPAGLTDDLAGLTFFMTIVNGILAFSYYQAAKTQKEVETVSLIETEKSKNSSVTLSDDGELVFELDEKLKDFVDYQ